jgi:hypothetical protein
LPSLSPPEANVLSSTSNFRTLPHGWLALAIGAFIAALGLGAWEMLWRTRGFVPSLADTEALWCDERSHATGNVVAILGSSRLQTGVDPLVVSHDLGGRGVVQLALAGADPLPVLASLANDPGFSGVVLLEYMPRRIFTPDSAPMARMQSFLATCSNPSLVAGVESSLERVLQRRFAALNTELHPIAILSYAQAHHALPRGSHEVLRSDRLSMMTFSPHPSGGGQPDRWEAPLLPRELDERFATMRAQITALRARGGRVVLYRPPVTDDVLVDEEQRFPAKTWLPRVASELGVPYIDFAAVAGLQNVPCPDGEHLDARDVPAATDALAHMLRDLL